MFSTKTVSIAKCEYVQGASQKNMLTEYKQVGYYADNVATILTVHYQHIVGQYNLSRYEGRILYELRSSSSLLLSLAVSLQKKDASEFSGGIPRSKYGSTFLKIKSSQPYCASVQGLYGW